ncbi:MAG: ABC transporter ATP-binding protein, partial [Oscillospiraceae bacterium]|nr:ABC transporter ATP-binding protein [Oscillospiraceae bacterium]MCD7732809.1 ABC transporter ATP-binding protein [Oscillospiraceae bacterium]
RSVLAKPQLIFADEPTGNLDKKNGETTIQLLRDCAQQFGQTLIMVTHDPEIAAKADVVIKIEDGVVID